MLHKRGIHLQTSLYLWVSGRAMSFPHQGVLGSSHPPQHRGLPVTVIGGTAAENYAAERMSSWFWQQRIICPFWIRRRNSSPGTGRPCSAKGALAPRLQCGQMAVMGAGHGDRGPQTPSVTQPLLTRVSCVTWTDSRQGLLESFHLRCFGL